MSIRNSSSVVFKIGEHGGISKSKRSFLWLYGIVVFRIYIAISICVFLCFLGMVPCTVHCKVKTKQLDYTPKYIYIFCTKLTFCLLFAQRILFVFSLLHIVSYLFHYLVYFRVFFLCAEVYTVLVIIPTLLGFSFTVVTFASSILLQA